MKISDLREKAEAEFAEAMLKVETLYCELVEMGDVASYELEKAYLEAIDEMNAKRAEVALMMKSVRVFIKAYGKRIVITGLVVLAILSVGYISGYLAV